MARSRWRFVISAAAVPIVALAFAAMVSAADPSPPPTASSAPTYDALVATNGRVGEELVWWGIRLLVICFIGQVLAAVIAFVKALRQPRTAGELAAGGLPLGDLLATAFRLLPDLIKTPAGIGALLVVLGVLMLLGTAAIDTHQLSDTPIVQASPAPGASQAPSGSCVPGQSTTPSEGAPCAS